MYSNDSGDGSAARAAQDPEELSAHSSSPRGSLVSAVGPMVEEPLSGAMLPLALDVAGESQMLLGTALRTKRIAIAEIQVYALGVYGAPEDLLALGRRDGGGALLPGPPGAEDLMAGMCASSADKVFCLTFLRTLSRDSIVGGLTDVLCNKGGVPQPEAERLLQDLPPSIARSSELRIVARPLVGGVSVSLACGGTAAELGGGERQPSPGVVRGLHEIFFGRSPIVRGLGESLQKQYELLALRGAGAAESSGTESDCGVEPEEPLAGGGTIDGQPTPQRRSSTLARIESGAELKGAAAARAQAPRASRGRAPPCSPSWKEKAGRVRGPEGYRFGDLSRTMYQRAKGQRHPQQLPGGPEDAWPGALVAEEGGEGAAAWVLAEDLAEESVPALAAQRLAGFFYKHHTSPVRGRLIPQWSLRYYVLEGGVLWYRRRKDGRTAGQQPLDGAHVVVEPPKVSHPGEAYVFRIHMGSHLACRLSSNDKAEATKWVLAIAAHCARHRASSFPGGHPADLNAESDTELPRLQSGEDGSSHSLAAQPDHRVARAAVTGVMSTDSPQPTAAHAAIARLMGKVSPQLLALTRMPWIQRVSPQLLALTRMPWIQRIGAALVPLMLVILLRRRAARRHRLLAVP